MAESQIINAQEQINKSWTALDNIISSLSDEQLLTLKRDGWLVRDHLIHISLAEQFVVEAFSGKVVNEIIGIDRDTFLRSSEDELNEICYQRTKLLSLSEIKNIRHEAHRQLLGTISRLKDDDLAKPFAPFDSQPTGMTMLDILRVNTFEHYDLHRGWIEAIAQVQ